MTDVERAQECVLEHLNLRHDFPNCTWNEILSLYLISHSHSPQYLRLWAHSIAKALEESKRDVRRGNER